MIKNFWLKKSIFKIVFKNTLFFALLLLCIELIVRISFPNLFCWGIKKDYLEAGRFGPTYGCKARINETSFGKKFMTDDLGFRINPDSNLGMVDKHVPAILILGDSISFGIGVEAVDSYPFILEKKLKEYRIINGSVLGYWIQDYYNILDYLIKKTKIDFEGVIVNICLNDFTYFSQVPVRQYFGEKTINKELVPNTISHCFFDFNAFLRQHSKTYLLLRNICFDTSKVLFDAENITYNNPEIKKSISAELPRLNNLAVNNKKWIIFFVFPYEYQLRNGVADINDDVLKPQRIISEFAKEKSLPVVDLYPRLKKFLNYSETRSDLLYVTYDPMHFSAEGNKVIAELVYNELCSKHLVKISSHVKNYKK